MTQASAWLEDEKFDRPSTRPSKPLSFLKFFVRYPIFLLAFGPPQFKQPVVGVDTSQAHFDVWNVIQVGWLCLIALRAIVRLSTSYSIQIPKQTLSILKLLFVLGLLFSLSVVYSPGRIVSAEYAVLYLLNLVCMVEFVVDAYRNPPDWMQCILQIRLVALLLVAAVFLVLPFSPAMVMMVMPGYGIRLLGGQIAAMSFFPEVIVIISAYTFLHSLESRWRAAAFFLVGLASTVLTQVRGAEISLIVVLLVLATGWAKMSRRSAYLSVAGLMIFILLGGVFAAAIGGERIWRTFNRDQDLQGILTGSGRTIVAVEIIEYCLSHPQGMGYISGIRDTHRLGGATAMHDLLNRNGGADNNYIEVLGSAGWLALTVYLIALFKTFRLGLRSMKGYLSVVSKSDGMVLHALRCSMLLLLYCLGEGIENSMFITPLWGPFYCQNILIVVILGISASLMIASRARESSVAR